MGKPKAPELGLRPARRQTARIPAYASALAHNHEGSPGEWMREVRVLFGFAFINSNIARLSVSPCDRDLFFAYEASAAVISSSVAASSTLHCETKRDLAPA